MLVNAERELNDYSVGENVDMINEFLTVRKALGGAGCYYSKSGRVHTRRVCGATMFD